MFHSICLIILISCFIEFTHSLSYIEIDISTNWTIENSNKSIQINNLTIPINVHHALEDSNLINNPLYRYNDIELRWIPNEPEWTFRKYINVTDDIFKLVSTSDVQLEFFQLDTISSIYLNDQFLLFTQNQFLKYSVQNFNSKLQSGMNKLEIRFKSPILHANDLSSIYPYRVPPDCTEPVQNGECHVNFLRKQQCSFSWDWGPAFAPIGINELIFFKVIPNFNYDFSAKTFQPIPNHLVDWQIIIFINMTTFSSEMPLNIEISIPEKNYTFKDQRSINKYSSLFNYSLDINTLNNGIELWWPNGYGRQVLYNLIVNCTSAGYSMVKTINIAFRSIQLIQKPVLQTADQGLTFYFEINNVPVFFKGSNWIPMDVFQDRVNKTYLTWLMKSVVEANMNVLRVWGGGEYETSEFYDIADEYGIMIWQDFMFACAMYPTNYEFLDNVRQEIQYQLWRLSHHPSIIVWSGNNENEAAVSTNWYGTNNDKQLYFDDYRRLYIEVIRSVYFENELTPLMRPFISSSPTNGDETEKENWIAQNPYDLRFGDTHFYNYYIDGWKNDVYPFSRFTSEFGFQSLPSYSTLASVYDTNTDMSLFSNMTNHRQHHGQGNEQLLYELQLHFTYPVNNSGQDFKKVIHLTQANQAMSYKTAAEFHRRNRDYLNKTSALGNCMGFMYWQLNDIWQAPTWSSIEFGGKWKMAHYYIKKAFNPFLISPVMNDISKQLDVYVLTETLSVSNLSDTVVVQVYKYSTGFKPLYTKNIEFTIAAFSSSFIDSIDYKEIESNTNCSRISQTDSNCLITFKLASQDLALINGENFIFYNSSFKQVNNIVTVLSIEQTNTYSFLIELSATEISLFVWLDIENIDITGYFSENGFHMTETRRIISFSTINSNLNEKMLIQYLNIISISPL